MGRVWEEGRAVVQVPAGGPAAHTTRTSWYEWYEFALSSGIVVEKLVPVLVRVLSVGGSWYEFRLEFRQGGPPPTQLVRVGARGTSSHYPRES